MKKAYRYRFYPTEEQKVVLAQTFGCCRFVYNHFLHRKKELWEKEEKNLSYIECSKALTFLKQEHLWLKEVSSVCLQQCLRHLQGAFEGFFKKRARFPKYKKKDQHQSCAFMQNAFTYKNRILTLAKMGPLEVRWSQEFTGTPTSLTVSKDSADRYFVSLLVEESITPLPSTTREIGIDLGISAMITNQKGETIGNPRFLNKGLKRLKARQKKLSRKAKGSKNRVKAKHYIAKTHAKISDKRMDFLHKITSQIVDENQVIVVESLGVKRMLQNKKLAREIADVGWGIFLRLLAYKSSWFGRIFVQIDKYFPSSKQCHHCGTIKEKLELNERQWCCFCCGMNHDRDINAAKNILQEGLRILGVPRGSRDFKPVELV